MVATWITDMSHYLDGDGEFPVGIPATALRLALFQGSIVAWVTSHGGATQVRTNVPCHRRAGKPLCTEEVEARLQADDASIAWECPTCGDRGLISGWQGTRWDRSRLRTPSRPNTPMQRPASGRR